MPYLEINNLERRNYWISFLATSPAIPRLWIDPCRVFGGRLHADSLVSIWQCLPRVGSTPTCFTVFYSVANQVNPSDIVIHSLGATWTQDDLGDELEVGPVSVIGELDPTGAGGTVHEVMVMLLQSLEPLLTSLERYRDSGNAVGIRFEAHKHQSATAQLGATRMSESCRAISAYFAAGGSLESAGSLDPVLGRLVDDMVVEIVRLQRRLRTLV